MTISSNDQIDLFAPLPPQSMGGEGSITTFNATTPDGKPITGNAVFEDTQVDANDPNNTTTTLTVFTISGGTQSTNDMLASAQPDEAQIFPDPAMDSSTSTTFTFSSEEVKEKAAEMNIDPNQLAADRALYGPALTDFAISQGVDPSALSKEINSASNSLGLTPPFSSLPQEVQNAVMLEVIISESNDNLPAGTAGVTPAKTANSDLVSQIRAEMDLQESLANPGMDPPALTQKDVNILYGPDFTNKANSEGQDPVQFALRANSAIDNLAPPLEGLTKDQKAKMIYEMLLENSGIAPSSGGVLMTALTASQRTQLSSSMSQGGPTTTTTSASRSSGASSLSSIRANGPNPWLSGNALTAFVVAFLEVIRTLMQNKIIQGKLEVQALMRTMDLAGLVAKFDMKEAKINQLNAMAGAISAGLAIGVAFGAVAYSRRSYKKDPVPQHAEVVPNDPKSAGGINAARTGNENLEKMDSDITQAHNKLAEKTATREKVETEYNQTVDQQIAASAKHEQINKRMSQRALDNKDPDEATWSATDRAAQDTDRDALATANRDRTDAATRRPILKQKLDNAQAEEKTAKDSLGVAERKLNAFKSIPPKPGPDGYHMETDSEFKARQKAVEDKNASNAHKVASAQAIGGTANQIGQVGAQATQAYNAMELGRIKGFQALLQGFQQIVQNSLQQATQAFSTNSDSIAAFISALQQLAQAVAQAMAAMLKQ